MVGETQSESGMRCRIGTRFEDLARMRDEWDDLVIEVGADIYMSYEWCRIWWEHYGTGRRLVVFTFSDEKRLVGIVPMFTESLTLGPVCLRVGKLVGSDFSMALCNPPVRRAWAGLIFSAVLDHLILDSDCDAVWLGPLSGLYDSADELRKVCDAKSGMVVVGDSAYDCHTVFFLPDTFDNYLQSLSKSQRAYYRRKANLLSREFECRTDVIRNGEQAEKAFLEFVQMHNAQWESQGFRGHFGAWPKARDFNLALVRSHAPLGRLRILRLIADGEVVSYQYAFTLDDRYYWRLPARAVAPKWDRFSLGHVALVKMIEEAIGEGMRMLEGGLGHYDYKLHLGAREYEARSILVASDRPLVRLRCRLFRFAFSVLTLVYFKIWTRRLSLRLPLRRRPLWPTWVRCRL